MLQFNFAQCGAPFSTPSREKNVVKVKKIALLSLLISNLVNSTQIAPFHITSSSSQTVEKEHVMV